jgi:hypothetical protein
VTWARCWKTWSGRSNAYTLSFAVLLMTGAALGDRYGRRRMFAAGAALGVMWGLVRGNSAGWGSAETLSTLAAGGLLAVAFVAWELRAWTPMLPMRLFRSRSFSAGNASIFFLNATLTGAIFFTAQFFQVAGGEGPLGAGLASPAATKAR